MQEDEASLYPQSFCVPQVSKLVPVSWWKSLKSQQHPRCRIWLTSWFIYLVLQRRPPKQEGTGSRIPTFVCMSKINHWGVGVTKLRDDIAGRVCNSHTAPFSKMAAINTVTHNKVMRNVKSMAYSTSKSTFAGSRNAIVTSDMPMVNELQHSHWQRAESSSFKPGKPAFSWMPVSTFDNFYTLNHEYTFSGNTAVRDNADLFYLSTLPPMEDTLLHIPQSSWTPGKRVRIWMLLHILTICTWSYREYRLSQTILQWHIVL